jgi:hypothetical protein
MECAINVCLTFCDLQDRKHSAGVAEIMDAPPVGPETCVRRQRRACVSGLAQQYFGEGGFSANALPYEPEDFAERQIERDLIEGAIFRP